MKNINEITNQSFAVLRTNPLLTTNVKIMVNDNVYISSFNNNVNDINYTATLIDPDKTSYENDLALFYKGVNKDLIYDVNRKSDDYVVYKDFSNQYEMQYNYGCETNKNKNYKEQYKFFAPLWLDGELPEAFIIVKTDAKIEYDENDNPLKDILSNGKIVKTFDLTNKSKIGRYIRNYKNNDNFPKFPIIHSFETDTDYCGIDVLEGGFTSKSEDNKDYLSNERLELENDEFITRGFERNNLAIANLLNLEFLFDDEDNDYKIYNYSGFYVNFNKIGTTKVKSVSNYGDYNIVSFLLNETKTVIDNKRNFNNFINKNILTNFYPYIKDNNDTYINVNKASLKDLIKNPYIDAGSISSLDNEVKNELKSALGDRKTNALFSYPIVDENENLEFDGLAHLKLSMNKQISYENFYKKKYITSLTEENFIKDDRNKKLTLEITNFPKDGDGFWIMPKSELEFVAKNVDKQMPYYKFDKSTNKSKFSAVDTSKILYTAEATVNNIDGSIIKMTPGMYVKKEGVYEERLFSTNGNLSDIASAVAKAINDNEYGYKAKAVDNKIFVEDISFNSNLDTIFALMHSDTNWLKVSGIPIQIGYEYDNDGDEVGAFWENENFPLSLYESSYSIFALNGSGEIISSDERYREGWDFYITTGGGSSKNLYKIYTDFGGLIKTNKMFIKDPITGAEIEIVDIYWDEIEGAYILSTKSEVSRYFNGVPLKLEVLYESDTDFGIMTFFDFKDFDFDLQHNDGILYKEYAKLEEDSLKELVLKSKVVPYINKFEAYNATNKFNCTPSGHYVKNGNDINFITYKNNHDYFVNKSIKLSYSKENNNIIDINDKGYNHFINLSDLFSDKEGNEKIKERYTKLLLQKLKNEVGGEWVRDASNRKTWETHDFRNFNIFNDIFNPTTIEENNNYINDVKLNSEFIGGSNIAYPSTIFNGLKYIYKKRVSDNRDEYYPTSEINGYKFANIFSIINTDNKNIGGKRNVSQNVISVIKNDKHNSIVILNELYTPYLTDLNINVSNKYTDYSLFPNVNENAKIQGYAMLPILSRDVVTISETYTNSNQKETVLIFGEGINLNAYNNQDELSRTPLIVISFTAGTPLGEKDLFSEKNTTSYVFEIKSIPDERRMVVSNIGYRLRRKGNLVDYFKEVDGSPNNYVWDYDKLMNNNLETIDLSTEQMYGLTSSHVYILNCGYKFFEKYIDNMITTKSFINAIKNNKVSYYNIDENGKETVGKYILDVDFGTEFHKLDNLTVKPDVDKPSIYKINSNIIGSVVELNDSLPYKLKKYTYAYKPRFKTNVNFGGANGNFDLLDDSNVIKQYNINELRQFLDRDLETQPLDNFEYLLYYYDNFNNKKFAPSLQKGNKTLDEFYFHKVNIINPDILKLSKSTDKLPLYPAINEIAIDYRKLNLFSRKYKSEDFHLLHLNANEVKNYKGTFNPIEDKFFFTSSIMNVKNNYKVNEFSYDCVANYDELQKLIQVKDFENVKKSLYMTNDGLKTYIDINLAHSFEQHLINFESFRTHLSNYINANESYGDLSSLEDDIRAYIKNNIFNRFFIKSVKIGYVEDPGNRDNVSSDANILYKSFTNFKSYVVNDILRIELTKHRDIPYKFNIEINFEA